MGEGKAHEVRRLTGGHRLTRGLGYIPEAAVFDGGTISSTFVGLASLSP